MSVATVENSVALNQMSPWNNLKTLQWHGGNCCRLKPLAAEGCKQLLLLQKEPQHPVFILKPNINPLFVHHARKSTQTEYEATVADSFVEPQ